MSMLRTIIEKVERRCYESRKENGLPLISRDGLGSTLCTGVLILFANENAG
jgi:hypothetical protein